METGLAPPAMPTTHSFDVFYRQAWPAAVRLAAFLTQDRSAAEEIAQDALVQIYRRWAVTERPEAYLRAAIVNRARNWRRHATVRAAKLPMLRGDTHSDDTLDELADAVAALPFRQRAVIVLRYHAGLSEAEIADALGCQPGTVKSLASRALARLEKVVPR